MAEIIPFRAWRYNEERVADVYRKFSPLFDVVNSTQLAELYEIPNNSIHISVPRSTEDAIAKWQEWRAQGIVAQDPLPGIYVYYQRFKRAGKSAEGVRKGFIVMARLNPDDIILHEEILPHSVNDRIALLEATRINIAPTHGLYQDPTFALERVMDAYMEDPLHAYMDYQGVTNELAIIQRPDDIALFLAALADKKIYLADGHHRLESSYAYQRKMQRALPHHQGVQAYVAPENDDLGDYHLIYLTNLCSDDLRILPTHRTVTLPTTITDEVLLARLSARFSLAPLAAGEPPIYALPHVAGEAFACDLVTKTGSYRVHLRQGVQPESLLPRDLPLALKRLDYTLLHEVILGDVLKLSHLQQTGGAVLYEKDRDRALAAVQRGEADCAFIMREVSMQTMLEICDSGAKMPPKSTYFYPKVVCGLVFGSLDR